MIGVSVHRRGKEGVEVEHGDDENVRDYDPTSRTHPRHGAAPLVRALVSLRLTYTSFKCVLLRSRQYIPSNTEDAEDAAGDDSFRVQAPIL